MNFFKRIGTYTKNCYNELVHKVSWPTRSELINSTVVVMIASVIIAIFVAGVDFVFQQLMQLVYGLV
ncbi:preprotein translocase subunit SecE [uncultured Porphyromonas sp.]|jgi:preprotein translocase subunit SecE|uniref:preprotein translocase subunit SecE n=1 Tax=uncultured Porphyromonas sp. TaxID=159274 RepID=UPI002631EE74|nr:preprotein translocase subunit SecE [uncultured Porphyromonas sp.]